ncbi:hypothetical protein [Amycolatopsis ultiminotia]|uniref:hypothetical protein n=1 Tax=Amycolatopsis ultiminotia TaxID=543629 RepID=UPI0031EF91B3
MRVCRPLLPGADDTAACTGGGDGVFEVVRLPLPHRGLHGGGRGLAAEHVEDAPFEVGQVEVRQKPAVVGGLPWLGERNHAFDLR